MLLRFVTLLKCSESHGVKWESLKAMLPVVLQLIPADRLTDWTADRLVKRMRMNQFLNQSEIGYQNTNGM